MASVARWLGAGLLVLGGLAPRPAVAQAPSPLADRVESHLDVPYAGTDNPRQALDIFVPTGVAEGAKLPLIAFIHGGGWQGGNKKGSGPVLPLVATGDYVGASIGYRLTNEAHWPEQAHDVKAAIRYLRANAEKYHIDPDRIAVAGGSAGGHLVAFLGTSGDAKDVEGDLGDADEMSSRVQAVVNFFGPTDIRVMLRTDQPGGSKGAESMVRKLIGGPLESHEGEAASASPVTYVDAGDAPTLTVHGDADTLVPIEHARLLHEALKEAGVESHLLTVAGGGHGNNFPPAVNDRVKTSLDHHLRGEAANLPEAETIDAKSAR